MYLWKRSRLLVKVNYKSLRILKIDNYRLKRPLALCDLYLCTFNRIAQMNLSRIFLYTFFACLAMPLITGAQVNVKDSALQVSIIYPTYAFNIPGGDMDERYISSHQIGAGYMLKGKNGWSIALEGNFIFRDIIKDPAGILSGILTSDGFIIDEGGVFANVILLERGFSLWAKVGKLFPVVGPNPNSGVLVQLGGGMLQHKIRIEVPNNSAPQLKGDYKKGYDHLCNGPALSQFVGYQHLGNTRKINFFAGLELTEAFTFSRRSYYFNDMMRPDEKRFDVLGGVKVGWYLPLYKKTRQKFYYY